MTFDQLLEAKDIARCKREDKLLSKIEKRENDAREMVGEIVRSGKTIYYICPKGGNYREGTFSSLVNFLIRNNYV